MPTELIATGVGLAYDSFVTQPQREKALSEATHAERVAYEIQKAERDKWLRQYESFIKNMPDTGYDQGILDAKYANVVSSVNEQAGSQRKQILENLAARGVRTSGVSEQSLGDLEKRKLDTLATSRNNLTIEQLQADRAAKTAKNNAWISYYSGNTPQNPSMAGVTQAQTNEAYGPLYGNQVMQSLLSYAGMAAGYGNGGNTTSSAPAVADPVTTALAARNLGYGSSPLDLNYNPTSVMYGGYRG